MATKRVVIVGGGFAGLNAAKGLGNGPFDVWLIDRTNHHLFQPLLYQVASAALSPADICIPIRQVLHSYKNITVLMGSIIRIDRENRKVHFANRDHLSFDYLILAVGAKHSYFGHNEWKRLAPGLKTIRDALAIRNRVLFSFEEAERCDRISEAQKYLTFVIVGGGPTGVELAGAVAEIAYATMLRDFRRINTTKAQIYLIEGGENILAPFGERLSRKARKTLEKLGVHVITGTHVKRIDTTGVYVGDRHIPAHNLIWAAGNTASPLLKSLDTSLDPTGRAIVGPDLAIAGDSNIFVLGDAAHCVDAKGQPLPALAPVASQQGKYVARLIRRDAQGRARSAFRYLDKGMMATIGKSKAVGRMGRFEMTGFPAWFAWCFVHLLYLVGYRNRLSVLIEWIFAYLFQQRGARLLYYSIDEYYKRLNKINAKVAGRDGQREQRDAHTAQSFSDPSRS